MLRTQRIWQLTGFGLLALALTGCPKKQEVKQPELPPPPTAPAPPPSEEPSLRGKDYQEVPNLNKIYFDLDQAILRSDARDVLQKNYQTIGQHPDWEILVEGHCDERGTTEYNLALGQRRAAAVRQYYMSLGLTGTRVATISYGKENPSCSDHTESCWSQNRRGVTKVRINPQAAPAGSGGASAPASSPASDNSEPTVK